MKRKFLEDMGLAKEQVDSIMAENGNDIEAVKQERDTYKTQLSTAQATLKSFEGVNISELQGKIQTLTTDLANKDAEYQKQLAERDFNDLLKVTAEGFNPRRSGKIWRRCWPTGRSCSAVPSTRPPRSWQPPPRFVHSGAYCWVRTSIRNHRSRHLRPLPAAAVLFTAPLSV